MFRLIFVATLLVGTYAGVPRSWRFESNPEFLPRTGRIVGGEETIIENVPYIVAMLMFGRQGCGGSIIKADVVLTAAHCLERYKPSSLSIRAGSTYKSSGGQVIGLTDFVMHPEYNSPKGLSHDIGVMLLSSPISLGESAKIIPMSAQGESVPDGTVVRTSGWGTVRFGVADYPEALRTVLVEVVNQETCNKAYNGAISDDMICAGIIEEGGKDACQNDSGGPLVSEDDTVLIGVVSWGRQCALGTHPGVFARVASIRDWVDTFLN